MNECLTTPPAQNMKKKRKQKKEENYLFNDALNTFYLWLYSIGHIVTLQQTPPHGLLSGMDLRVTTH